MERRDAVLHAREVEVAARTRTEQRSGLAADVCEPAPELLDRHLRRYVQGIVIVPPACPVERGEAVLLDLRGQYAVLTDRHQLIHLVFGVGEKHLGGGALTYQ